MLKEILSLEDIVRVNAHIHPDAVITVVDGIEMTFSEMHRKSNQVAHALQGENIGSEARIAFIDKNSNALFEVLFGACKIGAVLSPVNWRLSAEEMAYIINDSEADLVIVAEEFLPALKQVEATLVRNPKLISLGPDNTTTNYEEWLAKQPDIDTDIHSNPEDTALQLYTSGTTGRPKGAMLTNQSILAFINASADIFGVDPDARHLNCLPLFHVGGINWSLQAIAQGARCISHREFDSELLLKEITESKVTHLMTVPAVVQLLLASEGAHKTDYSSLRAIVYGGSSISERVLREAIDTFNCGFYGMYGSTELSFGNTLLSPEQHDFKKYPDNMTSSGLPFKGTTIKIVDPETHKELPKGEHGEIWVHSPQRAKGYWNLPEASAEVFRQDGWYRTGDIGFLKGEHLHLSDRLNDMVVSGGENVYPAEVERVLQQHPDISEAAAFGVPDEKWGESVAAVVIMRPESLFNEEVLISFTRQHLAHFKCPRFINATDELPRTASGKVQRYALRKPFWGDKQR